MTHTLEAMDNRVRLAVRVLLLVAAAILLLTSSRYQWWRLTLYAPQYPGGLTVSSTLTQLSGDVKELDTLNHYIGMMPLDEAAQVERALVPYALPLFGLLAVLSVLTRRRWLAWLLVTPLVTFPLAFLADLKAWLYYSGHSLDPSAPLSSTISSFTPTMVGEGLIAQFRTVGVLGTGFYLALAGALLAVIATWLGTSASGERV